jgi:hypothetical protein
LRYRVASIAKHEICIDKLQGSDFTVPSGGLLFWYSAVANFKSQTSTVRKVLLDDEEGDQSAQVRRIRENGAHLM